MTMQLDKSHSHQWTFSAVTLTLFHFQTLSFIQTTPPPCVFNHTFIDKRLNRFSKHRLLLLPPHHLRQSKQVRQGDPMMDGPWQDVIYNLSLLHVSVRQLRQTERDKESQKQKDAHRKEGPRNKKMKLSFISVRCFIFCQVCCSITGRVKAGGDTLPLLRWVTWHEAPCVCLSLYCGYFSMPVKKNCWLAFEKISRWLYIIFNIMGTFKKSWLCYNIILGNVYFLFFLFPVFAHLAAYCQESQITEYTFSPLVVSTA